MTEKNTVKILLHKCNNSWSTNGTRRVTRWTTPMISHNRWKSKLVEKRKASEDSGKISTVFVMSKKRILLKKELEDTKGADIYR